LNKLIKFNPACYDVNSGNKIYRLLNKNTLTAFNCADVEGTCVVGSDRIITVRAETMEIRRRTPVWVSGQHVYMSVYWLDCRSTRKSTAGHRLTLGLRSSRQQRTVKQHERNNRISFSKELITVATGLADGDEPVDDENGLGTFVENVKLKAIIV